MDVTEAVSTAKNHILRLFADESISNLGLEEAFFDEANEVWHITLGFSRPWDNPQSPLRPWAQPSEALKRTYKVVEIADKDNKVKSVKSYNENI
jgi:hypothetical protein